MSSKFESSSVTIKFTMGEFQVISCPPSDFLVCGNWELSLPDAEAAGSVSSPLYGFRDFEFKLCLNLRSPRLQFLVQLKRQPKANFAFFASLVIPSLSGVKPPLTVVQLFRLTSKCNCVYLNSDIESKVLSEFAKDGILHVKFRFEGRSKLSINTHQTAPMYAGLANQGATCYLNSLLQTLFHLPAFRMIVYQIPVDETKDKVSSIPYNLQKLFVKMQYGGGSCSTAALTRSFGWGSADAFLQRDVQELFRVFIDKVEQAIAGTSLNDSIAGLFRGKMESYVKCVNVDCYTKHDEEFYDLSLNVEGCSTLTESLKQFLEVEKLDRDNQYETKDFGKQDAILGTKLIQLPPVLCLHLKRFKYDAQSNTEVKITSRLAFPAYLDMSPFVENGKDENYELFGVLVHSGSAYMGHYYAYLRPTRDSQWFKFNDTIVTPVDAVEAIDGSFGTSHRANSAYMLIYYKQSQLSKLFDAPYRSNLVPNIRDTWEEKDDYISIVTESDLRRQCGELDLESDYNSGMFSLPSGEVTGRKLNELVADVLGFPLWKTNVWLFQGDYMQILAPDCHTPGRLAKQRVFARISRFPVLQSEILIFIKYFDCSEDPTIKFLTSHVVNKCARVDSVSEHIRDVLGIQGEIPLLFLRKQYQATFVPVESDETFEKAKFSNGTTLIVQFDPQLPLPDVTFPFGETTSAKQECSRATDLEVVNVQTSDTISTVIDYVEAKYNVTESIVSSYDEPSDHLFVLRFRRRATLDELRNAIATKLGLSYDPSVNSMLLYSSLQDDNRPNGYPLTRLHIGCKRIFFRCLDVPQAKLEHMIPISCICDGEKRTVVVEKDATIQTVVETTQYNSDECLVHVEYGGYQLKPISLTSKVTLITGSLKIDKKVQLAEDEIMVPVCHSSHVTSFAPFLFILKKGEKLAETKARLAKHIGLEAAAFNQFIFNFRKRTATGVISSPVSRLKDETELFESADTSCFIDLIAKPKLDSVSIIRPL